MLAAIAANVRLLRERRGWTQAQLAEELDVEVRYLQKIESGTLNFGVSMLVQLVEALETTPSTLLRPAAPAPTKVGGPKATKPRGAG